MTTLVGKHVHLRDTRQPVLVVDEARCDDEACMELHLLVQLDDGNETVISARDTVEGVS